MSAPPSVDEVMRVAESLGMPLPREEAAVYHRRLVTHFQDVAEFLRTRLDEERPPLLRPDRAPGHRPSSAEDPLNAWLWRCEVRGSADGLLAGKTVSFK